MSVHGAAYIKCMACDCQVSLQEAQSQWWICTTCGSYICQSCRALFLETGQGTCPGTIVRGVEAHPPHFSRFLGPRRETDVLDTGEGSGVVLLNDVRRNQSSSPGGRVIILENNDTETEEQNESNGQ